MTESGRAWLSAQGYQQVLDELDQLLLSHRSGPPRQDGDDDAWARHRWRERRIRYLQELVLGAAVGGAPPDDGVAEPGMVLTVRLDDAAETDTFLLAESGVPADREIDVYSPASPIGQAVLGAHEGDTRPCRLPDGHTISITLVAATPYDRG
ncbi:GreA/GreB family elongation factor [Actinomycetospora lemnae]|uniref:GreA/GreB family elongation factor n=1 Tax=Actinomycetospora lemnae TaxID=3019891 RepID=A0ABT5SZU8_9PSEU|nr:GreA/GreB family elongation factor [Actinomycetospora sp. DW7H6]MDD7968399.1 GreA/GreB family elongation factor [Actinomycetospora sp. DW7H6]